MSYFMINHYFFLIISSVTLTASTFPLHLLFPDATYLSLQDTSQYIAVDIPMIPHL